MALRIAPIVLTGLAFCLPATAGAAAAAGFDRTADYVISLAGVNIASVAVTLGDTGSHYDLRLAAKVSGLGQFVASGSALVTASGNDAADGLVSEHFLVETRANGETFSSRVDYDHGTVTGFKVSPPVLDNVGRVPIEAAQLTGVGDMLSAFVLKGGGLGPDLCDRRLKIFTGLERFDIVMHYRADDVASSPRTGYQGPVVLCGLTYVPISGHFIDSATTSYLAHSDRMLIWYAPLGASGYFLPYRVMIGTGIGDLSMVLTALSGD